ncbi:MAG: response regulator transcription factor [Nevskiales bacterium]
MRILIIEDDPDLAAIVGAYLESRGHLMDYAQDGALGLQLAQTKTPDTVILDLMLPGLDGLELCRRLREGSGAQLPVLMLTARDTLDDKLKGFKAGADDYLVKPFSMQELEARLLALYQRHKLSKRGQVLRVADLNYNLDTEEVRRGKRLIRLKPAARKLLAYLMRASHRVVSRQELEQVLWADEPPDRDALRVHIHAIRSTIDGQGEVPLVHTIRGAGYRISDDATAA